MKKLLIWDFDGVIADSEKLWVQCWDELLKSEKHTALSDKEKQGLLVGVSDKTRKERLEKHFPDIDLDSDFMKKISEREVFLGTNFMTAMPDVEKVMSNNNFEHCIATGATKEQHKWKMTQFHWIKKYMLEQDFFTVDMVKSGKPNPDIFLLAAKTKNYATKDCIVVGDSVNDFKAAAVAGMARIAFVGATGNNTPEYCKTCQEYGVFAVCKNMNELNIALDKWANQK